MEKILNNKIFRIMICILVIASMYFLPALFNLCFSLIGIKNISICNMLALLFYLCVLLLIFLPELKKEFKIFKSDLKNSIDIGFKYWVLGLFVMLVANIIINYFIMGGNIAANEEINRKAIMENPIWYTIISTAVFAPFIEEIIFRKSTDKIFENKKVYYFVSAFLFGFAHVLADLSSVINLIYIIPYGSLGFAFAVMDKKTNTTFTSILMHSIHNFITLILLLLIL